jgi:hypothetical protein
LAVVIIWVGWVVLVVCGYGEGVVYVPCWELRRKLCRSGLDSFLGFLYVWAIFGDMPFFFPMEETVLLPLPMS